MQPRNLALVGAALGGGFGAVGLIVPGSLATLFGIQLDATATALGRLVCASYVGLGAMNWAARDLTDEAAWGYATPAYDSTRVARATRSTCGRSPSGSGPGLARETTPALAAGRLR